MKKLVIILAFFSCFLVSAQTQSNDKIPYLNEIKKASEEYKIPLVTILAVIQVESAFNKGLRTKNRCGIMQVSYQEQPISIGDKCTDLKINLKLGCKYLKTIYEDTNHNALLTAQSYRFGYFPEQKSPPELIKYQKEYSEKITESYNKFEKLLK